MPKERYMCQLCANHNLFNQPKKGHKQKCPHRNCLCTLCALNTKRRNLDQMERHLKHTETFESEKSNKKSDSNRILPKSNKIAERSKTNLKQDLIREKFNELTNDSNNLFKFIQDCAKIPNFNEIHKNTKQTNKKFNETKTNNFQSIKELLLQSN